jgi:multidrug efflux pump subunit AcrB
MNLAEISLKNKTTMLVLIAVVAIGGIFAFQTMGRLEDPEYTIKSAQVITYYPGATAEEVAEEVTEIVEKAIQQMGQVRWIESRSYPGLSVVTPQIHDEYDAVALPQVWDELRRKVGDAQSQLPPGAGPSIVNDDFGDVYGVFFALYADGPNEADAQMLEKLTGEKPPRAALTEFSYRELKDFADDLEKELQLVKDVAKVTICGAQREVIYVEMSRSRMARLGISETQIYSTLEGRNVILPSGEVDVGSEFIRIIPAGELDSVEAIGQTLIQGIASDRQVFLADIADIRRGYEDPPSTMLRFDGRPALGIGVSTVKGGNVVLMGAAVQAKLDAMLARTPVGIELGIIYWQSNYVTASIENFVVSLLQALAIVIGVLLFAMGLRSGMLIGIILLLTVLATFIPMKAAGLALERISLGALIIALGMLVDNAIVVVEGIQIRLEAGLERMKAAADVVSSTMWPLLGGTFVAILAFGALGFSQDGTGEFTRSLFQVITYSLLLSWLLAVTVTPLLAVMMLKGKVEGSDTKNPYGGGLFRGYRGILGTLIRRRWLTVGVLVLLLAVGLKGFGYTEQSFFPDSTTPQFTFDYWTTQGTAIEETRDDLAVVEDYALTLPGVQHVATCVGAGTPRFMLTYAPEEPNTAYGQLIVEVEDYRRIGEVVSALDAYVAEQFPNAMTYGRRFVLGPGGGSKIEARFSGPDRAVLRRLSEEAQAILHADPGARDIRDDWRQQVKTIRPILNEGPAARVGLTRADVSNAMQRAFGGVPVGLYREGDKLIPITSRAPDVERSNVDNLYDLQVWSPAARATIPIGQLVTGFETVWEDAIIATRDRQSTITAQCNQVSGNASVVFERVKPQIEALALPPGYKMEWGGEYENSLFAKEGLAKTFPLMILLMVLIVVIQFNSIRLPVLIWLTVPLAIVGVTLGLLIPSVPFGFMALLGALSLIGMQVKNSIVLVDEINQQIRAGKPRYDALIEASLSRLRPVSMAALTTVLGMIPLLPDAFFVSLAVTIMGGLAFATILTMVVVPTLYAVFFRIRSDETLGEGA